MLLLGICATSAFDFSSDKENVIDKVWFDRLKNTDEASVLFWNWLLNHTRLTAQHAAMHNIYQLDSAGFFYDLNGDNSREILATHHSTALSGAGNCYLYILKFDDTSNTKYRKISGDLYFDATQPLRILEDKAGGYRKIKVNLKDGSSAIFVFDKKRQLYIKK